MSRPRNVIPSGWNLALRATRHAGHARNHYLSLKATAAITYLIAIRDFPCNGEDRNMTKLMRYESNLKMALSVALVREKAGTLDSLNPGCAACTKMDAVIHTSTSSL